MKKSILNLDGAQELSKNQQKTIVGGALYLCSPDSTVSCPSKKSCKLGANGWYCA